MYWEYGQNPRGLASVSKGLPADTLGFPCLISCSMIRFSDGLTNSETSDTSEKRFRPLWRCISEMYYSEGICKKPQGPVRVHSPGSRAPAHHTFQYHRTPNGAMDRPTDRRSVSLGVSTPFPAERPRLGLQRRLPITGQKSGYRRGED